MATKKNQKRIAPIDSRIFASLLRARRPIPIKKLAQRVDVTWPTANIHVKKLKRLGVVKVRKTTRRSNVFIDPNYIKKLKKKMGGNWPYE